MRRSFALSAAFLALLVVGVLAPPAAAQEAPACATMTLAHEAPGEFEPGETREVAFSVTNGGQLASIAGALRTSADAAWTVEPAELTFTVAPGESARLAFNVTAPGERNAASVLNAVASAACTAPGSPVPISTIPQLAAVADATDSVELATAAKSGFAFDLSALEDIPPLAFVGVLAAFVILGGAVAAGKRRQAGFDVRAPEPEKGVRSGRGASFPLEVKNRGRAPDTARFEVGDVPDGWSAFMALPELTLAAGESRTIWLMVRSPPGAETGAVASLTVAVRSKEHPRFEGKATVRAQVKDEEPESGSDATRVQ